MRRGDVDAGDLLADACRRSRSWDPWLEAVVTPLEQAGTARGPLAGVVAGIKEVIAVAGAPRGCGAPEFLGHPAPETVDATVVARLRAAGASVLGTTRSQPLAYGLATVVPRNPRAPGRVTGGSSSGAAAALAAGIVHVALGTDTAGSVRVPAACCGVVGLSPTHGLVPMTGVAALAWSLDTVGPLATSVAEVSAVLAAIAGYDPDDPESIPAPEATPPLERSLRVGVPVQVAREQPIDPDVRRIWQAALDALADAGAAVTAVDLPLLHDAQGANRLVIGAEAAAIHGERYASHGDLLPLAQRERLRRGVELRASAVARARRTGSQWRADLRRAFCDVDVLCIPTMACRVPTAHDDPVTVDGIEESVVSAMTRFTGPWSLAGVPAGSVPAGRDDAGAPVGVQIVGPWWSESLVLQALGAIEGLLGGPWPSEAAPPLESQPA